MNFNHQTVRLIAKSEPSDLTGASNGEELVSYCARVSNPKNQENFDTADKLLGYCVKHQHWSIFEMVNVVMEIKTTRDIGRQILRHRSFSFQEFSQRYAEVDVDTLVTRQARLQHPTNRQDSVEVGSKTEPATKFKLLQEEVKYIAVNNYREALSKGIAKEQARALLPEGLTPSVMYMNGTLRSWLHFIGLRSGNGTQLEAQDIANKCGEVIKELYPSVWKAFKENEK